MGINRNQKIVNYILEVCSRVKFRDIHQDVKLELAGHIEEIVEEFVIRGLSEEEAVDRSLAQMGDADLVGRQLNKVHKPKPEWSVLLISVLFISIGLLATYFIQRQSLLTYDARLFESSVLFSSVSVIVIVGLYFFDYRKLERYAKHIYLGTLFILIITVLWGNQANGSRCWLDLGPFNVNFVTISPVLFIAALAGIFSKWDWNKPFKLVQAIALFAVPLFLILLAPSISTGAIFIFTCMVLMIFSGAKLKQVILTAGSFFALLTLPIIAIKLHIIKGLGVLLNPVADPLGNGYLNIQLSKVISHSGFLGQGLTFTPQVLPELHTDFIFAFITYTFGWIASFLLIALVVGFLVRIALIAGQIKIHYGKLLISGFVSILAIQFLWNILMNLGLAPISGVGLPFISYSCSQLVTNAATVGIISSIYRRRNVSQEYVLS
ncbi:MAG: FtsW/RodA/SpoVE family cell cycle protein [Syntrophomonadaceae bacterium]